MIASCCIIYHELVVRSILTCKSSLTDNFAATKLCRASATEYVRRQYDPRCQSRADAQRHIYSRDHLAVGSLDFIFPGPISEDLDQERNSASFQQYSTCLISSCYQQVIRKHIHTRPSSLQPESIRAKMPRYSCGHRVGHDSDRKNYNCKDCMHQDALAQEHAITEHYDEKIAVIEDWKDPMYGNRYTSRSEDL